MSTKTVRVYHGKGLLPEPERDASGYRRYTAWHAVELIKIHTLADAPSEDVRQALRQVDPDLTARIRRLRETRDRLRRLESGPPHGLPPEVAAHLDALPGLGFTGRAAHPDTALALFRDQADALTRPETRRTYLESTARTTWSRRTPPSKTSRSASWPRPWPATGTTCPARTPWWSHDAACSPPPIQVITHPCLIGRQIASNVAMRVTARRQIRKIPVLE
ncbi:MerR family DNA-binding transcriptional regulator [Amycolatopsis sp. NPDC004378]